MHRGAVWRLVLFGAMLSFTAGAAPPEPPHFASLTSDKVYMREGPSYAHRVLSIYRRKGLPVDVLAAFDVWRRVADAHGTIGWVHSSMVSDRRTVVVTSTAAAPLRKTEEAGSAVLALVQPGAVAKLEACDTATCDVSAGGIDGWVDKKNIWGVGAGETFH